MGKKNSSPPVTTKESSSTVALPKWVSDQAQETFGVARNIANRPWEGYTGQSIAPLTGLQNQGLQQAQNAINAGRPAYDNAYQGMGNAQTWANNTVGAGSGYLNQGGTALGQASGAVNGQQIADYMNPYIKQALDPVSREMYEMYRRDSNQQHSKDAAMGALGNSGRFIGDADRYEKFNQGVGDMYAQGYGQSYQSALAAAQADKNRAQGNASIYNQMANTGNTLANDAQGRLESASKGMSDLANQDSSLYNQSIDRLLAAGGVEQQYNQQVNDSNKADFYEQRDWDKTHQLNTLIAAMSGTPYGQTTTGTSTETGPTPSGGGPWQAIGSIAGAFLSDEESKEDRAPASDEELADFILRVPVESYDYKPDVVEANADFGGRKVGPMSQRWAKEAKGLFGDRDSDKVIPMPEMAGALMGAVRQSLKENRELKNEVRGLRWGIANAT
jgi:hypothetical protein